ncbi:hypothetical protein [Streptomyces sp. NPDC055692]
MGLPLGETSYFRITGVLADGTPAAVVHYSAARGDYVQDATASVVRQRQR